MSRIINKLRVTGFRSFPDLTVEGLGRVNLITGRNNAGKSTLLEAIRILATEGSPATFFHILNYREESDARVEEVALSTTPTDYLSFCSLFRGYPNLADCGGGFTITGDGSFGTNSLTARIAWFVEVFDPNQGSRRFIPAEEDLFGESNGFAALSVELPNRKRVIRLDRPSRFRRSVGEPGEGVQPPCIFLDPFSSRSTSQLASMWDMIALTDAEAEVVRALQIAANDIQAVSMVGADSGARDRTAIAKSNSYSHPVPLRSFGDGVNRLFGLILSLSCSKGGVLLVDEIENGLHHSILIDVWKTLFRLSRALRVQIFATSHSWDCIEAFQVAANEDPADGVLVRLARKKDLVIPTVIREKELQIVSRDKIEVR